MAPRGGEQRFAASRCRRERFGGDAGHLDGFLIVAYRRGLFHSRMRYVIAALVALIASFIASAVWVLSPREINYAVAKIVPAAIVLGTVLFFGLAWFPATLIAYFLDRQKVWNARGFVLVVSAVTFLWTCHRFYETQKASEKYAEVEKLRAAAAAATNDFARFEPFVDDYCSNAPQSYYQPVDPRIMVALAVNPATPPQLLERLAAGLKDSHELLDTIAEHPSCPERLFTRLSAIPHAEVHLARNPVIGTQWLESLSLSTNPFTRASVAGHPHTPPDLLQRLANDKELIVRQCVTNRMNSLPKTGTQ